MSDKAQAESTSSLAQVEQILSESAAPAADAPPAPATPPALPAAPPTPTTMVRKRAPDAAPADAPPAPSEAKAPPNVASGDGEVIKRRVVARRPPPAQAAQAQEKRRVAVVQTAAADLDDDSDSDYDEFGIKQSPSAQQTRSAAFGQQQIQGKVEAQKLQQLAQSAQKQPAAPGPARFFQGGVNNPISGEDGAAIKGMFAGSKPNAAEPKVLPYRRRGVKAIDEQAAQQVLQGANEVLNQQLAAQAGVQVQAQALPSAEQLAQQRQQQLVAPPSAYPAGGYTPLQPMQPMQAPWMQPMQAPMQAPYIQPMQAPWTQPMQAPWQQAPCAAPCCQNMAPAASSGVEQELRWLRAQLLELTQAQSQIAALASPRSEFDAFKRTYAEAKQDLYRALDQLDRRAPRDCSNCARGCASFRRCCDRE
jgi:hypothetical protein